MSMPSWVIGVSAEASMGIEVGSITTNPIASSDPIARDRILLKNFKCAQFLIPSGIGSGIKPTFFHLISITAFVGQKDEKDRVLWKF